MQGWKGLYMKQHNEMATGTSDVVKYVEQCMRSDSLEVGDYLQAVEDLNAMQLGFKDVQMFLFKPKLNVLLNLVGLHYCIFWLKMQVTTPAPDFHFYQAMIFFYAFLRWE